MELKRIGTVRSPYTHVDQIPRCAAERLKERAVVEVDEAYAKGLADLEGFSHVILVVRFHLADREMLTVVPPIDDQERGVFATRSPMRPNHLGVCIVELEGIEGRRLQVKGVDVVEGTPLLDIKPYTPYDVRSPIEIGWLEGKVHDWYGVER
jgi:tRNA-Thr(GGU) m(6)t(6)A37 methyltransferase TsaA